MQKLISAELECIVYAKQAIEWLLNFYIPPYFHVAYEEADNEVSKESPNAATSMIGRIIHNGNELAEENLDGSKWFQLKNLEDKARKALSENELHETLPLRTMGILPPFSTCYLAEFISIAGEPSILTLPAYAIAMRRILFLVHQEREFSRRGISKRDKLHPFLIYRCVRALRLFNDLFKKTCKEKDETFKTFKQNFHDRNLLIKAAQKKWTKERTQIEEDVAQVHGYGENYETFEKYIDRLFENCEADKNIIDKGLMYFLEESALREAMTQIARQSMHAGPELDPSALAFSLGVLKELDNVGHANLISQGLKIIFESCDNGLWHAVIPFYSDDKGRAIFVPSIEVANIAILIYAWQYKRGLKVPDIEQALSSTDLVQRRLCEHINGVEIILEDDGRKQIKGWCTDKAPSHNRVDSWVTALALAFFLRRVDLIKMAKKKSIWELYSWTPSEQCSPKWDDIVDPDIGLGEGLKQTIYKAISSEDISMRNKSPMFLLYGPPGTAKTTLVQSIANELHWDLLTLSPADFISNGMDKIEEYSRKIFYHLTNLDKCIVLMDEMDSLFRDRDSAEARGTALDFIVPAFLPKLQRLRDYIMKRHMAVFIVTNYYELMDSAIARMGRIDYHLPVLPYSDKAKMLVLTKFLSTNANWVTDHRLTPEGGKVAKKIFAHLSPLLVYREIEQLSVYLLRDFSEPKSCCPKKIDLPTSITPEFYKKKRRKDACLEVCALIDRLLGNKVRDYQSLSKEAIKDFFEGSKRRKRLKSSKMAEWRDLIEFFASETREKA